MLLRRALFYWQFTAAVLLPIWVIVMRGLNVSSTGWDLVVYIVLGGILSVAMFAVAAITTARKGVRTSRAVSNRDAIALGAWHVAIIAYGVIDSGWLATLIILLAVVAFWNAVIQLFTETRDRVKSAFALPDFPVEAGHYDASTISNAEGPDAGKVIIIETGESSTKSK